MIAMVQALIEKGIAYEVEGDVYFRVGSFSEYGKLSGKNLEELISGARVEVDERKQSPLDFALWKKSKEGEPFWDCPWGKGRPGWHIECSAMSQKYLGKTFDIHGGGMDLVSRIMKTKLPRLSAQPASPSPGTGFITDS